MGFTKLARLSVMAALLSPLGCSKASTQSADAGAADAGATLRLGVSQLLTKDVPYQLAGTDVVVINRGAGMQTVLVDGDPNKENHVFFVKLEVMAGGRKETIEPTSKEPAVWSGYRFRADAEGYTWGKSDGAVIVERAP